MLTRLAAGEDIGTSLIAETVSLAARKQWLADHVQLAGRLTLDAGAVRALAARRQEPAADRRGRGRRRVRARRGGGLRRRRRPRDRARPRQLQRRRRPRGSCASRRRRSRRSWATSTSPSSSTGTIWFCSAEPLLHRHSRRASTTLALAVPSRQARSCGATRSFRERTHGTGRSLEEHPARTARTNGRRSPPSRPRVQSIYTGYVHDPCRDRSASRLRSASWRSAMHVRDRHVLMALLISLFLSLDRRRARPDVRRHEEFRPVAQAVAYSYHRLVDRRNLQAAALCWAA